MENYSHSSSYPDSGNSSPHSHREVTTDDVTLTPTAATWEDLPHPPPPLSLAAAPRVKLLCSYGGRIQPRSHDNQLSYVGGETKILTVERSVRYSALISKLNALSSSADDVILKYQLPGEDLDALVSVTNDEDLEHMIVEYDRLHRMAAKPVPRLRLFLFPNLAAKLMSSAAVPQSDDPNFLFKLEKEKAKDPAQVTSAEAEMT